jgi:hypothetical protein
VVFISYFLHFIAKQLAKYEPNKTIYHNGNHLNNHYHFIMAGGLVEKEEK